MVKSHNDKKGNFVINGQSVKVVSQFFLQPPLPRVFFDRIKQNTLHQLKYFITTLIPYRGSGFADF